MGRNVSESQAGLERAIVDADSARTGGRLSRHGEEPIEAPVAVYRGSGSGTRIKFSEATCSTRLCAESRPQHHLGWRQSRESERPVVPAKPGNAGGGKEPHFRALLKETKARVLAQAPAKPVEAWRLPRELDAW